MDKSKDSFWFGCTLKNFLFLDFDIDSYAGLLAVCCASATLVLVLEILKASRVINKLNTSAPSGPSLFKLAFTKSTERSNLIGSQVNDRCHPNREIWRVTDILGHFLEVVIGYLLMMIAMTFNSYVMISICLGGLIGYLLYGSVVFNMRTQMAIQRIMCVGCEIKPGLYCQLKRHFISVTVSWTTVSLTDGDLALIIGEENELASTSETHHSSSECHDQQVFMTAQIQIHNQS